MYMPSGASGINFLDMGGFFDCIGYGVPPTEIGRRLRTSVVEGLDRVAVEAREKYFERLDLGSASGAAILRVLARIVGGRSLKLARSSNSSRAYKIFFCMLACSSSSVM